MSSYPAALLLTLLVAMLPAQHLLVSGYEVEDDQIRPPDVPSLCQCPMQAQSVSRRKIKDFNIELWKPSCGTEIILTLEDNDRTKHVCLSPDGSQGKRLLRCWDRINQDQNHKKRCIRRRKGPLRRSPS
ncbi:C-X-C motif chemokine 9-like isoform X2 [Sardina pilchardus]|uniref:C-X-C motif chemokine 9-like isoform X2 n=1 Tax=Sardina pilchardus TaxID=27697 RepID=UPI002E0E3971